MIIKGQKETSSNIFILTIITVVLGTSFYLRFIKGASHQNKMSPSYLLSCDFEHVDGEFYNAGNHLIHGAASQSDEKYISGNYSSKLSKEDKFGFTYIMDNPKAGNHYLVSVWSLNPHPVDAYLVVSAENEKLLYKSTAKTVERNGNFWDRRELRFKVPEIETPKRIKIYVFKDEGANEIYFDDFIIKEIDPEFEAFNSSTYIPKTFNLILDNVAQDYFKVMKEKSISQGTIFNDGSTAKAKLIDNGESKKCNVRLKGDWLDHISGYPSYRVNLNSETSWEGMQSLSIQEPHTRGFLREWVFFKFLDYSDVLHPRYDFCYYKENNNKPIVFSYEEHFTKNLVEHSARREGPILKMTEDRMWDVTRRSVKNMHGELPDISKKDNAYWMSEIRSFKEGKLLKNPTLMKNFELAHTLMDQFKYGTKPVQEIFDVERLAKYLAWVDICLAHHAITWHNQRFYYNPVTALLEPIGFDAFTPEDPKNYASINYASDFYINKTENYEPLQQLLYDDNFVEVYFKYLHIYSDPILIENILNTLEEDIVARENFINQRYKDYKYDRHEILNKAKKIRLEFPAFENSLRAYKEGTESDSIIVKVQSAHFYPLAVYTDKNNSTKQIIYPQNVTAKPKYETIKLPKDDKYIYYQVVGIDIILKTRILEWSTPAKETPKQYLGKSTIDNFKGIFKIEDEKIIFLKGVHTIKEPLIIPNKYDVIINVDTEIHFAENGFIMSYAPVYLTGEPNQPIVIKSLDGKSGSFTVLQADKKSILKHVNFENQNTFKVDQWNLTGAVSFYESDVDITHVAFRNNNCEDALNIVRSEFTLDKSLFYNTFGDAFDADFCKGKVSDCNFLDSGNDAIDVSGSNILISNTNIQRAGDKGISAGEASTVRAVRTQIDLANIGSASKDLSQLTLHNVQISNCKTGVTAFQKKPEFGPAKIFMKNTTLENVEKESMIEKLSTLVVK